MTLTKDCPDCFGGRYYDQLPEDEDPADACARCEGHGVVFEHSRPHFSRIVNRAWGRGWWFGVGGGAVLGVVAMGGLRLLGWF